MVHQHETWRDAFNPTLGKQYLAKSLFFPADEDDSLTATLTCIFCCIVVIIGFKELCMKLSTLMQIDKSDVGCALGKSH